MKYTSTFRLLSARLSRPRCRSTGNCLCPAGAPASILNETYDCSQFGIRKIRKERGSVTRPSRSYLSSHRKSFVHATVAAIMSGKIYGGLEVDSPVSSSILEDFFPFFFHLFITDNVILSDSKNYLRYFLRFFCFYLLDN